MFRIVIAVLAGVIGAGAFAAPTVYKVNPGHTLVSYELQYFDYSVQSGVFTKIDGQVVYDPEERFISADITIDPDSYQSFFEARDNYIRSDEDFLNTSKFKEIKFVSQKVKFSGDAPKEVEGKLTFRGITKDVKFKVTRFAVGDKHPIYGKPVLGGNAEITFDRTDFGMNTLIGSLGKDITIKVAFEGLAE